MRRVAIAPFSNNALRDWPTRHYREAVGLLLERLDPMDEIAVIGTRGQRLGANEVVRGHPAPRVANLAGRLDWSDVLALIRSASCVIGNNSGIAHMAQLFDVPTICVFGGSHQRSEWAPIGRNTIVLSRDIACSPCQFNHIDQCRYGAACLRDIAPRKVADAAMGIMQSGRDPGWGA